VGSVDAVAVVSAGSLAFRPFKGWVSIWPFGGALGTPGSMWLSEAREGGVGGGVSDMVSTVLPRQSHPVLPPPPILDFVELELELPRSC